MLNILKKIVRAPLSYLADLRKITLANYLLLHTNFSPTYPIMIFTSLASTLALSIYIIYYIFNIAENDSCFRDVRVGSYIISILYPVETVLFFICLTGSIALSKSNCWKVLWMLIFGPILCGFGFGEIGFIQICVFGTQNERNFSATNFMKNPVFIQAMVYLYISFIILYFILVPSFEFLYSRQKEDTEEEKQRRESQSKRSSRASRASQAKEEEVPEVQSQKTCCSRFICILYYFMMVLFCIAVCFILLIKILGPIIFTYVWIEMGRNSSSNTESSLKTILGLSIFSYFGPIAITIIVLGIQRVVKLGRKKQVLQMTEMDSKEKNTIDLTDGEPRNSEFSDKIKNSNKSGGEGRESGVEMRKSVGQRRNSVAEQGSNGRETLL